MTGSFSIGKKILLGFSILILMYLAMAMQGYSHINEISALTEQIVPLGSQASSLQEFAIHLESLESAIDKFFTVGYKEDQEDASKHLDKMLSIIRSLEKNADSNSMADLQYMERLLSEIQINLDHLSKLQHNSTNSREINEKRILIYELINSGRQKHGEFLSGTTDQIQVNVLHQQRVISDIIREFLILGVAILVSGIILSLFTSRSISQPVKKLIAATDEIGHGHLNINIPVQSDDEIGQLASAFNEMTRELQKTTVSKDYMDNIIRSMLETLIVITPDGTIQKLNRASCDLLGYRDEELVGRPVEAVFANGTLQFKGIWLGELVKKGFIRNIEKTYLAKDGKKIPVSFSGAVMQDEKGDIQGIVCVAQDITERKKAEEQIRASLAEKEVLLREIYHRVKNNMQIISSLLKLQSGYVKEEKYHEMFKESQNRIMSMSLVHEKLYRSKDLAQIDFKNYIKDLTKGLLHSYGDGNIKLNINVENISLGIDSAIPCGLIINELVTNSLKHAFPQGREGEIKISLIPAGEDMIELTVSDNGIGFPKDMDFRRANTLGLHLVTILAENQLNGEINLDRSSGSEFQIRFKKGEIMAKKSTTLYNSSY